MKSKSLVKFPWTFLSVRAAITCMAGLTVVGTTGCLSQGPKKLPEPREYVHFPAPPDSPRVQFLCSLEGEMEGFTPSRGRFLDFLSGRARKAPEVLTKPYGLDMQDGRLYVADTIAGRVAAIDFKTKQFRWIGTKGKGMLRKPVSVRAGADGRIYVADSGRRQIIAFDREGRYQAEYGDGKSGKLIDSLVFSNELFALDIEGSCIQVYDLATGKTKRTIGKSGTEPGEFNRPNGMASDVDGNLYICDAINLRIQKLDHEGKPLKVVGRAGKGVGELVRPRGLAVARDGILYVADSLVGVVQLFNPEGQPLMNFGGQGFGEGQLALPAQVTLNYDSLPFFQEFVAPDFVPEYLILVANQLGVNKVSVFAFGHAKEKPEMPASAPASPQ